MSESPWNNDKNTPINVELDPVTLAALDLCVAGRVTQRTVAPPTVDDAVQALADQRTETLQLAVRIGAGRMARLAIIRHIATARSRCCRHPCHGPRGGNPLLLPPVLTSTVAVQLDPVTQASLELVRAVTAAELVRAASRDSPPTLEQVTTSATTRGIRELAGEALHGEDAYVVGALAGDIDDGVG
jgi:hypothetical protein